MTVTDNLSPFSFPGRQFWDTFPKSLIIEHSTYIFSCSPPTTNLNLAGKKMKAQRDSLICSRSCLVEEMGFEPTSLGLWIFPHLHTTFACPLSPDRLSSPPPASGTCWNTPGSWKNTVANLLQHVLSSLPKCYSLHFSSLGSCLKLILAYKPVSRLCTENVPA